MTIYHSNIEWRAVAGYEGLYEVSNTGFVRSLRRNKIMSPKTKKKTATNRYARIVLWKDGVTENVAIHRLVAEAFLPKVDGKDKVNHIDHDTWNNDSTNLEWCTQKENVEHMMANGRHAQSVKVKILHVETQATFEFRSLHDASVFVGHFKDTLSQMLRNGKTSTNGYEVLSWMK